MKIDYEIKKHCVELYRSGMKSKEVYDAYFSNVCNTQTYHSFRGSLARWNKKQFADDKTLGAGTYPDFIPHRATVQVNAKGDIVQAWIKQHTEHNIDNLISVIQENTTPVIIERDKVHNSDSMLEIPLFDMHFPITNYEKMCKEIVSIIGNKHYNEINIVIGQDLFHNDGFRGTTTNGTNIDKVDIAEAWRQAKSFWFSILQECIKQSNKINLIYSKGNHDECISWAFVKLLEIAFPQIKVDDSMKQRKCIYWKGCFIGVTHGEYRRTSNNDLRGQFAIQFPEEFAKAKIREIHTGHLHHEKDGGDTYGMQVRRLSTGVEDTDWSDDNGFIGTHKRFMLFEYVPNELKVIHYIY